MTQTEQALSLPVLSIRRWLKRKIATLIGIRALSTVISFGLGIVILIGTFYFAYAVIWLGYNAGISSISELLFGKRLHLSHNMILVICWCFIGLLFFENTFVERDYWSQYSVNRSQWSDLWMAGVLGSLGALLINADASAKVISDLLLIGPRLIESAFRSVQSIFRLRRTDINACALSIEILVKTNAPVSVVELEAGLSGVSSALSQLSELGAVLLVRKEPPKIILDPDLRHQLRALFKGHTSRTLDESGDKPIVDDSDVTSLYELLGLTPSASLEEIRKAYRRSMKQWHPDVFIGKSDEAAQAAEEKAKKIIAAYEALLSQHKSRP